MSNVKFKGGPVDPRKPLMVRSWRRVKFPYSEAAGVLETGNAYFVAGVRRQTAHSAAQNLSKKLGVKILAVSAIYEGEKGYAFFKQSLESWVEKGTREGWLTEKTS